MQKQPFKISRRKPKHRTRNIGLFRKHDKNARCFRQQDADAFHMQEQQAGDIGYTAEYRSDIFRMFIQSGNRQLFSRVGMVRQQQHTKKFPDRELELLRLDGNRRLLVTHKIGNNIKISRYNCVPAKNGQTQTKPKKTCRPQLIFIQVAGDAIINDKKNYTLYDMALIMLETVLT